MALLFDRTSIGREDRAAHFTTEVGGVVVVADTVSPVGNLYPTLEWNLTNTFTGLIPSSFAAS